jgi:hypothetical protein
LCHMGGRGVWLRPRGSNFSAVDTGRLVRERV